MSNKTFYDILVVGGGHAGLEAVWACAQFDSLRVCLVTAPGVEIASAPCNPAVGGVGKGQVVREIDALGGLMGKLADLNAIQYRTLNDSKGYAVQSTRVQIDKVSYPRSAEKLLAEVPNLQIIRSFVQRIWKDEKFHVELSNGIVLSSSKIILTTGTFLGGKLHTGREVSQGGRVEAESSPGLATLFSEVKSLGLRFKTGTPPRIKSNTLDYSKFTRQDSDGRSINFHLLHDPYLRIKEQVSCYIARTNSQTLGIIRENKEESPIFNGQIEGVGPRYCPSIEDKAFRYPDRDSHHVFVEPESLELNTIYPNGVSTSLPKSVQDEFVRTIEGFESAEIEVYGYAVEYDVVDTSRLDLTLQYEEIPGLYFAGQVNGTSGYEEAAGQGLIAGINASLALVGKDPLILSRHDSYIGVMIEDLVSSSRDEPYRLFTARTENRLAIREDNTIERMYPYRKHLGLKLEIDNFLDKSMREQDSLGSLIRSSRISRGDKVLADIFNWEPKADSVSVEQALANPRIDPVDALVKFLKHIGIKYSLHSIRPVAVTAKYSGYINKSSVETDRMRRLGEKRINWEQIIESPNISNECRQRIERIRPTKYSQLMKIQGIRPATLSYVASMF